MEGTFTIEWVGLQAWISKTILRQKSLPDNAVAIMRQIGQDTFGVLDSGTPIGTRQTISHRPGTLKSGNELLEADTGFSIANHVFYGKFVNYGTSKMRAQPFFSKAVEYGKEELSSRL